MTAHPRRKAFLSLILTLTAPNSLALHRPSVFSGTGYSHGGPISARRHDVRLLNLRGGGIDSPSDGPSSAAAGGAVAAAAEALADATKNALTDGPHLRGVAALAAVAAATVVPLALIRQSYAFVVGCGASVATMSLAMMSAFGVPSLLSGGISAPAALSNGALVYGVRLAAFNAWKDVTSQSGEDDDVMQVGVLMRLRRIPLAVAVAILYSLMICSLLYALRSGGEGHGAVLRVLQWTGVAVSYVGLIMSAISDVHRYAAERRKDANNRGEVVSPTGGLFRLCRHPNYVGEVLFWIGLYVGGAVSFGTDLTAWMCATLGLSGIVSMMLLPWILHWGLRQIKSTHTMDTPNAAGS